MCLHCETTIRNKPHWKEACILLLRVCVGNHRPISISQVNRIHVYKIITTYKWWNNPVGILGKRSFKSSREYPAFLFDVVKLLTSHMNSWPGNLQKERTYSIWVYSFPIPLTKAFGLPLSEYIIKFAFRINHVLQEKTWDTTIIPVNKHKINTPTSLSTWSSGCTVFCSLRFNHTCRACTFYQKCWRKMSKMDSLNTYGYVKSGLLKMNKPLSDILFINPSSWIKILESLHKETTNESFEITPTSRLSVRKKCHIDRYKEEFRPSCQDGNTSKVSRNFGQGTSKEDK